jgi:hypothetical protein
VALSASPITLLLLLLLLLLLCKALTQSLLHLPLAHSPGSMP